MMKPLLASVLVVVATVPPALAQTAATPSTIKPKLVTTVPVRPALQTPADTANAMEQNERTSIQSDLAWLGLYNGAINGEVSDRMVAAIKEFQKNQGAKVTGVLNPQERTTLSDAARKPLSTVGWKIVSEPVTGARIGLPLKLVPQTTSDGNGTKWSSTTGTIQIFLERRKEANATPMSVAAQERKAPARRVEYSVVKPDFFVLSGLQGLKRFYIRGQTRDSEVRVMTILYDQATEGTMTPVTVAMSSAFNPFPGNAAAPAAARKPVEYSTGIVVSADGAILTDRAAVDGCQSIVVGGYGNAARVADDEAHELALLRVYGASGLVPMAFSGGAAKPDVTITGIADPQSQGGRNAVTGVPGTATSGDNASLTPAPPAGFSGAAVVDSDGKFAGLARIKPAVIAGPATGASTSAMVPADAAREFLTANKVAFTSGPANAKASVLRVICVRK